MTITEKLAVSVDSYTDMLRDEADLHRMVDDGSFALATWHEPSVGIFGGAVTPFFSTEAELEDYCRRVLLGQVKTADLDEYLAEVLTRGC